MSAGAHPLLRLLLLTLATLLVALAASWGVLALAYQARGGPLRRRLAGLLWAGIGAGAVVLLCDGRAALALAGYAAAHGALLLWWRRLTPSGSGEWAADVALLATGSAADGRVRLHHVRDFLWRTPPACTARWESREYDLERLRSVDMIMSYWRGPSIAHALFSFGFDGGEYVAFSVEVRRRRGQQFSEIGGFFKRFELVILAAQERDVVRLRTNVRREDVYLYRLRLPGSAIRALFLAYVEEANQLAARPRFYHTVTANCTTLVYQMMNRIVGRLPLDLRLLFSGYLPQYVRRIGGLTRGLSFDELRARGRITERARAADASATFCGDIRRGVPGCGK